MLTWINYLKNAGLKVQEVGAPLAEVLASRQPAPPTMDELVQKVLQWGDDRRITANSTPQAQLLKCVSELGELADATLKDNDSEIIDGLGDVLVTLIMYAGTHDLDLRDCLESAYNEIKDRKGYLTPEGVFVKEEAVS